MVSPPPPPSPQPQPQPQSQPTATKKVEKPTSTTTAGIANTGAPIPPTLPPLPSGNSAPPPAPSVVAALSTVPMSSRPHATVGNLASLYHSANIRSLYRSPPKVPTATATLLQNLARLHSLLLRLETVSPEYKLCAQLVHVRLSSLFHLSTRIRSKFPNQAELKPAERWIAMLRRSLDKIVCSRYGPDVADSWEETWATKWRPRDLYRKKNCSCQSCEDKCVDNGEWGSPWCVGVLYGGGVFERWGWEVAEEVGYKA